MGDNLEAELAALDNLGAELDDIPDLPSVNDERAAHVAARLPREREKRAEPEAKQPPNFSAPSQSDSQNDDLLDIDVDELLREKEMDLGDDFPSQGVYHGRGLLRQTWINERGTPELLPYDEELVDEIKRHIDEQQETIYKTTGSEEHGDALALECRLYQLELDRINYILASYLRTRLRKIQSCALHILQTEEYLSRLSPHELEYAQGYVDLMESHYNQSFLNAIPGKFRELTTRSAETNMVPEPDLTDFVFLRVKEDLGSVDIGDEFEHELKANDVIAASYIHFRGMLEEEKVEVV